MGLPCGKEEGLACGQMQHPSVQVVGLRPQGQVRFDAPQQLTSCTHPSRAGPGKA